MATQTLRIGSVAGLSYDDGDFDSAVETDQPIKAGAPVDPTDVIRLEDLEGRLLSPVSAVDVDNPTELNSVAGVLGALVLAYQIVGATGLNEYTLYAYDASGPVVNAPYIMDADGAGDERWIAVAGKYSVGPKRIGDATNYMEIAADGEITLHGTARVTRIISVTEHLQRGASAPAHFEIGDYCAWKYGIGDDSKFSLRLPLNWAAGTDIVIHITWAVDEAYATSNAEVRWQCDWSAIPHNNTEAIDAPTHSGSDDTGDVNIPANAKYVIESTVETIPGASLTAHDILGVKISRIALVAGANPAQEPFIIDVHFIYTADKLGQAT